MDLPCYVPVRKTTQKSDLLTICYLSLVHSIATGSIWELELKFLSVSWHCRRCFELHHRIVLGKKNERPSKLFHGFVRYSLQDKTQGRTTHQPYILTRPYLQFFFKEKKKKCKDSQEFSNSVWKFVSYLNTTVKEQSVPTAVISRACFSRARL